jgi:hypothetical protein
MDADTETARPVLPRRTSRAAWVALGILTATAGALILYMGRGLTFFRDEWTFVLYRDGHDLTNFLSNYAGHLLLWPTFFFLFLFKAVGLDHYDLYRLAALPLHLACAVLVYLLARRRVGDVVALAPAAVLLFLGSAWMDLLWPFQIAFTGAIAFGLGAMLSLTRDDLPGDAIACACLLISLGWSGAALPFIPALAAGLLVRRRFWRRVWVLAAPAVIYLAWQAKDGQQNIEYAANLPHAPSYALKMAGAGITGITGLPASSGPYLAALLGVLTAIRLWQLRRGTPLAWEALAGALAFWGLTAAARAQEYDPTANRYVYQSAVFILLLGIGLAPVGAPRRALAALVLVLAALTLPSNISDLQTGREELVFTSNVTSAELGALELGREVVDPEYSPPLDDFPAVPAAAFFATTARYGSTPADSPAEIAASPEYARQRADAVLVDALKVRVRPVGRRAVAAATGCRRFAPGALPIELRIPREGLLIEAPAEDPVRIGLRRFAAHFSGKAVSLGPGRAGILRPHRDAVPGIPWHARIAAPGATTVCRPRAAALE